MKKIYKLSVLPLALFLSAESVNAATPGAYFGVGGGYGLLTDGGRVIEDQDGVLAGRLFFGYNFTRYLGIEANYSALGKVQFYSNNYPDFSADYSFNAASLVGKAYLPISEQSPFNVYALLGGAYAHNTVKFFYDSMPYSSISDNGLVATAGFGASYDLNKNLTLGLEFSAFGEKKTSARDSIGVAGHSLGTLSLAYKF